MRFRESLEWAVASTSAVVDAQPAEVVFTDRSLGAAKPVVNSIARWFAIVCIHA